MRAFQNLLYVEPGFSRAADVHVRLALVFKTNNEYDLCVKVSLLLLLMCVCMYMDASTCSLVRLCVFSVFCENQCLFLSPCMDTYMYSIDISFIYFLISLQKTAEIFHNVLLYISSTRSHVHACKVASILTFA